MRRRALGIIFAALLGLPDGTIAAPINSDDVHVVDGDTIRVRGIPRDVRLVGFNAPETTNAKCERERAVGSNASHRLRELVDAGNLDFELVACSCPPGTEGTRICNYGRRCGT